jgi:hypothetical protein
MAAGDMLSLRSRAASLIFVVAIVFLTGWAFAQSSSVPSARLLRAVPLELPGSVDSNSPAVWSDDGTALHVFMSYSGIISEADGPTQTQLGSADPVAWFRTATPGGLWMEGVVADVDGTWYGYYHNEVAPADCAGSDKVRPRIGAARSRDQGRTWRDLGVILEASDPSNCDTSNTYDVGGVGDFSVMLDPDARYLYIFYSDYSQTVAQQGVAVARMLWANRDRPVGALAVWNDGLWLPANWKFTGMGRQRTITWTYPAGTPMYGVRRSWHSGDGKVDAFWGPSIHWNTYLERYVMLLNHANTGGFGSEGIYVAYAPTLDDPRAWSAPQRLVAGGSWYPQVIGLADEGGTDKRAGQRARFYISGRSTATIEFSR